VGVPVGWGVAVPVGVVGGWAGGVLVVAVIWRVRPFAGGQGNGQHEAKQQQRRWPYLAAPTRPVAQPEQRAKKQSAGIDQNNGRQRRQRTLLRRDETAGLRVVMAAAGTPSNRLVNSSTLPGRSRH
jgi:hypothetical protein